MKYIIKKGVIKKTNNSGNHKKIKGDFMNEANITVITKLDKKTFDKLGELAIAESKPRGEIASRLIKEALKEPKIKEPKIKEPKPTKPTK